MTNLIAITCFALVLIACVFLHWKIFKLKTVNDYENSVISKFQARSHRLIVRRQEIDLMPQSHAKLAAHDEWLENVYLYLEDYEAEVAEEMVSGNFTDIKAYAGIRLIG